MRFWTSAFLSFKCSAPLADTVAEFFERFKSHRYKLKALTVKVLNDLLSAQLEFYDNLLRNQGDCMLALIQAMRLLNFPRSNRQRL